MTQLRSLGGTGGGQHCRLARRSRASRSSCALACSQTEAGSASRLPEALYKSTRKQKSRQLRLANLVGSKRHGSFGCKFMRKQQSRTLLVANLIRRKSHGFWVTGTFGRKSIQAKVTEGSKSHGSFCSQIYREATVTEASACKFIRKQQSKQLLVCKSIRNQSSRKLLVANLSGSKIATQPGRCIFSNLSGSKCHGSFWSQIY